MDTYDSVSLQKVNLKNLSPILNNALIVGIIIGKQRPKEFTDAKASNGANKAVWNFTLRDSRQDYINATFWGTSEPIQAISEKFHIGDVVDIINPDINVRDVNDYGEQFRPMVTSPYSLTLNERSNIVKHVGDSVQFYVDLLHYPTKPVAGFVPLRDIHQNGAAMKDITVDVLGAVKGLSNVRNITTKSNEVLAVREIEVFDQTSHNLKISLWDTELIERSNSWKPRFTILFLTDLKIQWSNFSRSFTGSTTRRTIITENPVSSEAANLFEYAKNAPIKTYEIVDQLITAMPDPNTIQDVMSIKQVHDRINALVTANHSGDKQFTALLYAFVSHLDLDGISRTILAKCGRCRMPLKHDSYCENSDCTAAFDNSLNDKDIKFDLRIVLSDHTGSLLKCRLGGQAAELALGCSASEFLQMNDDQKCMLKWRYLLERCAVPIAVLIMNNRIPIITVLRVMRANPLQVAQNLPVY